MNPLRLIVIACFFACITLPQMTFAQDNLRVSYSNANTVPDFLNVCGDTDEVTVTIRVNGTSTSPRENITAIANLFEGIRYAGLNVAATSAGVTELPTGSINRPEFSIPDLSPVGVTSVDITFFILADCSVIDTLDANNALSVFDEWETQYTFEGAATTETEATAEYRDALAVPFFTIDLTNTSGPFRVGDCFDRQITISNSGLAGFVDTIQYQVVQGPGASIQAIDVNGIDQPIFKTLDPMTGDTIVNIVIAGPEFMNNTTSGGPGDGDGFINSNETVTITETLCVANCTDTRTSTHDASWGCFGRFCNSISTTDFVRIGDGAANPEIATSGTVPTVNVGYCQPGTAAVTYTNNGVELDAGFGTMIDIQLGIGLGPGFLTAENGYTITAFNIGGVNIPATSSVIDLNNNPGFTTDPDGPGGLEDFDGDGFFDDLALTESVEISVEYNFDCSLAQGTADNCVNDFSSFLSARVTYSDACNDGLVNTQTGFVRPSNVNSAFEDFASPDAFADGPVFFVTHTESRSVREFANNCGGNEVFRATVVLPAGVSPVPAQTTLIKNASTLPIPMLSSTINGDTLIMSFDASLDAFINGNYELTMAFQADCNAAVGQSTFPTTFEFVCPPCGCEHVWYCSNIQGPYIHKDIPPCPFDPAAVCPAGFRTTGFEVNRTTFGFTDDNYTTKIDPANANRKVAVTCDSVEMDITGVVGQTPISGGIGFNIDYDNPDGSTTPEGIFDFSGGMVRITQGGTDFFCDVTPADMIQTPNGVSNNIRVELPNCLSNLGLTLNPGDSIQFLGNFAINVDGPYDVQFTIVPNIRANPFAVIGGVDEFCETFGDIFTVARTNTLFAFPNSTNFPEGCEETFLNYQVISVFNDFSAFYGNEFYPSIKVDSIKFTFDTQILNSFDVVEPTVSIPGHPTFGNDFFPVPSFEMSPSGDYVAFFDTLDIVPSLNEISSFSFNFRVRLIPNCESLLGSANNDNTFNFDPEIFYQNRFYAATVSDPSCVEFVNDLVDNDITYTEPPTFLLNPLTNPNFILVGDTATWTTQLCNNSFTSDAGITWIALDNIDGDINVVSVVDVSDPANPETLTLQPYGTVGNNVFAFSQGVDRAVGSTDPEDLCNTYVIQATVNNCGELNLLQRNGWACQPISDPTWTPEDYPPCDALEIPLSISTRDPFLDADVEVQPIDDLNICDVNSVTIRLKNTDLGATFDLTSQFILPTGATLVPGSVQFAHPASTPLVPIAIDPVIVDTTVMGTIYEYANFANLSNALDLSGLPGDDLDPTTEDSEILIQFDFMTGCDFQSGSVIFFNFQGLRGCNGPSNLEAGETLPINISGALNGVVKLFDIALTDGTALVPGENAELEVTVTNLVNEPSSNTGDVISTTLPLGVFYVPGTSSGTVPAGYIPGEPTITMVDGQQVLTWPLAGGLSLNEIATIRFSVNTPMVPCDVMTLDGFLQVLSGQDFICSIDASVCPANLITNQNGGSLFQFPLQQGAITFDITSATSTCASATTENVTYEGNIVNGMMPFPATSFDVEYFGDIDGNGMIDSTDVLLGTFLASGPIPANGSIPFVHTFEADISEICNILISSDISVAFGASCGVSVSSVPTSRLLNAGQDQVICENDAITSLTIGDPSCDPTSYTYSWTGIGGADVANLSATDIPAPTFTINMADLTSPSLTYVLATTRPGCTTMDTVVLTVQVAPTIMATADMPTACPGSSVVLTATGADTYEWFDGTGLPIGTTPSVTVIPTGNTTYTVNGTDVNGCTGTGTVDVILDPAACACTPAQITSVINNASNCGESIGSATVNIDLNTADFTFNWDPDLGTPQGNGETRTDLPFGGYLIDVVSNMDANCSSSTFALIQNADGPEATASTTPATCNAPDGTATITPLNFTYDWSDGGSGAERTDLVSGLYFVTITDPANPTCQNVISVIIGEDNPLEADVTIISQPDCGVNNGEVSIAVTGGSGMFSFMWPDGVTGATRNDLAAGIYLVTITDLDITGCQLPFIFILTDDVPQGETTINEVMDISCFGQVDGGVDFSVAFDPLFTPPADTLLSNGISLFTNGALPAGSYCIQINDGNGCVAGGDCFTIVEPDPITLQVSSEPDCNNNGILAVNAIGGTPPYTYDWADLPGMDNSSFRQNLGAGLFNVQVNDANNCTTSISGIEVLPCPCESVEISSVTILETECGDTTGLARIGLVGDPSLFTYTWTPDIGTTGAFDNERSDLQAGQYTVVINGSGVGSCVDSVSFIVTSIGGLEGTAVTTPASCEAADGTATLSPATSSFTWPLLPGETAPVIASFRDDLPAGNYVVTITDGADDCPGLLEVTIDVANPLLADVTILAQPDCGESNGQVTINPNGVTGPFEFLWPDGDTNATRTDLPSGLYVVTITQVGGSGCELPFLFVLTDNVPPATVSITGIDSVSCAGQSDGGINFDIAFDPGFTPPADTIISDGFFVFENGNLPVGNYCITILDGNGCVAGGECFEILEADPLQVFIVVTEDCAAGGSAIVTVTGGIEPYTFDWSDLPGTDDMQDRTGLMADTLTLTVTDVNGCLVREDEVVIPECSVLDCDFFNGLDTLVQIATICDDLQELCFDGILLGELNTYEIFVDDSLYNDIRGNCNIEESPSYQIDLGGQPGPFELVSWMYNDSIFTGTFNTVDELLALMNSIDTNSFWQVSTISSINIEGGNPVNDYGDLNFRNLTTGVESEPSVDFISRPFGSFILVDTGFHEVIFVDTVQMCSDTITVFLDPSMLLCDVVFDTIMPLDTVVFCIDTMDLDNVVGPIATVEDICADSNGTNVGFEIDSAFCVTYTGITLGIDTACFVLCDILGNCDTTNFIVTVVSDPEIVRDTIFPGDIDVFCLDISIFEGTDFTIENFCPEDSDGQVDFFIDTATNCIEYAGNEPGIDSACISICDNLGFCDTTFFFIVVDSITGAPIAVDDIDTTIINTPTVIDIKGNDIIGGTLDTAFLVTDPIFGEASINLDCSLTYDPDNDFCDVTDTFDYVICNELGCDTATVSIFIDCEGEIVIFTAVSPNGDGVNDFFHIGGIDAFPNNRLCIFNRWGNQVLLREGYNNEFNGRWENRDLPDGTYFYILELNDADNRVFKGFFEMYR